MFRFCLLFALITGPIYAEVLTGPIRVIDADTIDIGAPETVRLIGIDAPESDQTCLDGATVLPCGAMVTEAARAQYEGRQARCDVVQRDRYGRYLATCYVDGEDMNAALVRDGLALRYRDEPAYLEEEKEATLLERGVWAYDMMNPAAWRAEGRARDAAANAPGAGDCAIKGNISERGRIYHLPGMRSYGATRINERRGERWFCGEAEARAAGWRRAGEG